MNKPTLITFVFSLFISSANGEPQSFGKDNTLALSLGVIEDASQINRVLPQYPKDEARLGREGWVKASYIIEPSGETSNILIEDSSGRKSFEKAAKKAISRWHFNPATENGAPIQQCQNSVRLDFKMSNKKSGVTRKFMALYKRFVKALDQKEASDIEKYATRMLDYTVYAGAESYYQFSTLADYYRWQGNKEKQLDYLNKAIAFAGSKGLFSRVKAQIEENSDKGESTDKLSQADQFAIKQIYPVLYKKLILTLELELLGQALYSSKKLTLIAPSEEYKQMFEDQTQTLEKHIASNNIIKTRGVLNDKAMWNYHLLRNEFSFVDLKGTLYTLDVRCQNRRHLYTVNEQSTWTIPTTWKNCRLFVKGEADTTFNLLEYPSKNITASVQ